MKSKISLAKWEPIKNATKSMILDSLLDTYEGFRLLLRDPDTQEMLKITFEGYYSYRNTNESFLLKTWGELEGVRESSFYIIEGSQYIEWFHEQSEGMHTSKPLKHYAIFTNQDCVEVLAELEPVCEWL